MSTIKSSTTLTTAYSVEADTTGALVIQTGVTPTTAVTVSSAQVVTLANALPVASGGTGVTTSTGTGAVVLGTSPSISGAVLSSMASSVITSGTAVASTSGTSIDFTSIPSWVKRITVMLSGVSTNGSSLQVLRIGSGSIDTTGYASTAFTAASGSSFSVNSYTDGFALNASQGATSTFAGSIVLTLLGSNTWVSNGNLSITNSEFSNISAGTKTLSGVLDRVRITTVNGTDTFDAGTVNILFE
jgi:hypothetical protein